MKGLLKHQGIEAETRGEALAGALGEVPVNESQVSVWVDDAHFTEAANLYQTYLQKLNSETEWNCAACHESNPESFDFCWQCHKARDQEPLSKPSFKA